MASESGGSPTIRLGGAITLSRGLVGSAVGSAASAAAGGQKREGGQGRDVWQTHDVLPWSSCCDRRFGLFATRLSKRALADR